MRIVLAAISTVLILAAMPAPAAARFVQRWPAESSSNRFVIRPAVAEPIPEVEELQRTIREGRDAGQLDRREARQLRRQAAQLNRTAREYARDGLTLAERHELRVRAIVALEQANLQRAAIGGTSR